jgi:hypothetical protein
MQEYKSALIASKKGIEKEYCKSIETEVAYV